MISIQYTQYVFFPEFIFSKPAHLRINETCNVSYSRVNDIALLLLNLNRYTFISINIQDTCIQF